MKKIFFLAASLTLCFAQADNCFDPSQSNRDKYKVDGFVGSPLKMELFQQEFKNPPQAQVKAKKCRSDGHCMIGYEFDVYDYDVRIFDKTIQACRKKPATRVMGYNGTVPAPTIRSPAGHEVFMRFNNKISNHFEAIQPCLSDPNRYGRAIAVHNHGFASIAAFDGWAEDQACGGESKDYVIPGNEPRTVWYHDHALDYTAGNVYLGMRGLFIVSDKIKQHGMGSPYNMENMDESNMILTDYLIDQNCQFRFEQFNGNHQNNFYGDINTVNGIPWPKMNLQPKWHRFRFLDASISRPYLLQLRKEDKKTVFSHQICFIIAGDGGYRHKPAPFPKTGLLIGVAQRYQVVCDFSNYSGKTVYWWNSQDNQRMKAVPYFCYSNQIAKIQFKQQATNPSQSAFDQNILPQTPVIRRALSDKDLQDAMKLVKSQMYHRQMKFQRSNGHWVINGETWHTFKLAASNVGQNSWEVWKLQTSGGWFHPIHIHLVDFFVLARYKGILEQYEQFVPKDVVFLTPGAQVYVLARWGAHQGQFMFHCHNLIHEDSAMLRSFKVVIPKDSLRPETTGRFTANPLVGYLYDDYKYADPEDPNLAAVATSKAKSVEERMEQYLKKDFYAIFYPTAQEKAKYNGFQNPWETEFQKMQ